MHYIVNFSIRTLKLTIYLTRYSVAMGLCRGENFNDRFIDNIFCKFTAECVGERITKIDQHMMKL